MLRETPDAPPNPSREGRGERRAKPDHHPFSKRSMAMVVDRIYIYDSTTLLINTARHRSDEPTFIPAFR
ncbi:MAG TPA: hypothetical protein VGQ88_03155, partial [Burkholderiales bacterium]|nr:hypothetical protein [Burkholderiales bacterium]